MGEHTAIGWTDHTFNIAWGCTKYSAGCKHCYADTFSNRLGLKIWGANTERRTFGEKHWNEPLKWNKKAEAAGKRAKVFCSSMCDIFEDHPTIDQERAKLWELIRATPWLDWQLLTKRADRILANLPPDWGSGYENVWIGVSTENQEAANERIPLLMQVPASVRFISAEPLLGPIVFEFNWLYGCGCRECSEYGADPFQSDEGAAHARANKHRRIHQVIVGGESGHGARPMHPDWVLAIRDQCDRFISPRVSFFFKQWGEWCPEGQLPCEYPDKPKWQYHSFGDGSGAFKIGKSNSGNALDGRVHEEFPK